MRRAVLLLVLATGCVSAPPRVLAARGYEVRWHEVPGEAGRVFSERLDRLDARLRAVYGLSLPEGEVWIDPDAFREEPIGGTYDWWSDRIVLAERDESYLAHELVHRYNRYAFGDLPRWLDEGLAYALARGGFETLDDPRKRLPAFEAIAEVREARTRARGTRSLPTLAEVFEDPYGNGHLNVRIATVVVDRLLRDRSTETSTRRVLAAVVEEGRALTPEAAASVLERAAFRDFPRADELRALLADETAPDELVDALVPLLDLEGAEAACANDARARRRLALLLDRDRSREGAAAEVRLLEKLLQDPDPRVARAATYSLGARGDQRMIGPLIEVLKDAPLVRWVRPRQGRRPFSCEPVPIHRTLARLAGETPPGVAVEPYDEAYPLPYRVVAAWESWWGAKQRNARPIVPALRRRGAGGPEPQARDPHATEGE